MTAVEFEKGGFDVRCKDRRRQSGKDRIKVKIWIGFRCRNEWNS
jgi:hypothetical protein